MENYFIKIELESESILGNGESIAGYIDSNVLLDEFGLPFYKGKTLKGKLREECENIREILGNPFTNKDIETLFGYKQQDAENKIAFSNCYMSENIRMIMKKVIKERKFDLTKESIIRALTDIRTFTAIEEGKAKDGSLRNIRVINKGISLYCNITILEELTEKEEILLAMGVSSLKHIGLMANRGKGLVKCSLHKNDENITENLVRKVKELV